LNVKRVLLISALIVLALVVVLFIAVSLIDPDRLREPIVARLSDQLDRSVELGELDLALFPAPALCVRAVRIEGHRGLTSSSTRRAARSFPAPWGKRPPAAPLLQTRQGRKRKGRRWPWTRSRSPMVASR
jgi:hypothetical protein